MSGLNYYCIREAELFECKEPICFFLSPSDEERATYLLNIIKEKSLIKCIVIIKYAGEDISSFSEKNSDVQMHIIEVDYTAYSFLPDLSALPKDLWNNRIVVDISCIHIPEMFTIVKYLAVGMGLNDIDVLYTMPYDYRYSGKNVSAYESFIGDLTMFEPLGFSGITGKQSLSDLFIFMGFEGALGLKVIENADYTQLCLVNNLPSYYPKYKDFTVENNYSLMTNAHKYLYTPADNPFETYNFLLSNIDENHSICLAPLSTKPVGLGVCLYALKNENDRVVFPVSNRYNYNSTKGVYKAVNYHIDFKSLIPTDELENKECGEERKL